MRVAICRDKLVVRAPAKVNLFLEVLGRRPDGFHEIATLMVAIRLMDTLIFKEDHYLRLRRTTPSSLGPQSTLAPGTESGTAGAVGGGIGQRHPLLLPHAGRLVHGTRRSR